jgi:hypothetical protein
MTVLAIDDIEFMTRYAELAGCTVAQLKHAIESVGDDEEMVREFLQDNGLIVPQHPVFLPAITEATVSPQHPE